MRATRDKAGFWSTSRTFSLPVGRRIDRVRPYGYFIDLSVKARTPKWPPDWLGARETQQHVITAQWGLGAYERFLSEGGEEWLNAALACGEYLAGIQEKNGPLAGGWLHYRPFPHTYTVQPRWISGMVQGEAASLLVRLGLALSRSDLLDSAVLALRPMSIDVSAGGAQARLGNGVMPQEYPTNPPAHVLNGAIFALWGYWDVATGCGSPDARRRFEDGVSVLAANIGLWDAGYWSRYDLYPHRVTNVASDFYHALHISQLEAMLHIAPDPQIEAARNRFLQYRGQAFKKLAALAMKVAFRVTTPRNPMLARIVRW